MFVREETQNGIKYRIFSVDNDPILHNDGKPKLAADASLLREVLQQAEKGDQLAGVFTDGVPLRSSARFVALAPKKPRMCVRLGSRGTQWINFDDFAQLEAIKILDRNCPPEVGPDR